MQHLNYIEIDKHNLIHNFETFKKNSNNKMCAVVKGNAYGHGIKEIVEILKDKIDYFQVDDYRELIELRKHTNKKALVLGYIQLDKLEEVANLNAIPGLYNLEAINKYEGEYHLKIDAFLGRQGILTTDLEEFLKKIKNKKLVGIYTHFSNIEDIAYPDHHKRQIKDFKKALEIVKKAGFKIKDIHTNSTAGSLVNKDLKTTITRLGIGLYGMWPSVELQKEFEPKVGNIKPVIKWVSHVAQVKELPEGYPIGYGLTYITDRPKKIAVIPQGYSDGVDRKLSNKGTVIINEQYCNILGRIAMNMFVVDVSHLKKVKPEDKVILLGKSNKLQITAEEIANKTKTINYEVTTKIYPLLPRVIM